MSVCVNFAKHLEKKKNQTLIGSIVIDVELGREDHNLILRNCV
jgi:hypothetical protein